MKKEIKFLLLTCIVLLGVIRELNNTEIIAKFYTYIQSSIVFVIVWIISPHITGLVQKVKSYVVNIISIITFFVSLVYILLLTPINYSICCCFILFLISLLLMYSSNVETKELSDNINQKNVKTKELSDNINQKNVENINIQTLPRTIEKRDYNIELSKDKSKVLISDITDKKYIRCGLLCTNDDVNNIHLLLTYKESEKNVDIISSFFINFIKNNRCYIWDDLVMYSQNELLVRFSFNLKEYYKDQLAYLRR